MVVFCRKYLKNHSYSRSPTPKRVPDLARLAVSRCEVVAKSLFLSVTHHLTVTTTPELHNYFKKSFTLRWRKASYQRNSNMGRRSELMWDQQNSSYASLIHCVAKGSSQYYNTSSPVQCSNACCNFLCFEKHLAVWLSDWSQRLKSLSWKFASYHSFG